jgi:hypothetical protein
MKIGWTSLGSYPFFSLLKRLATKPCLLGFIIINWLAGKSKTTRIATSWLLQWANRYQITRQSAHLT